ncbi:hypothetical protein BJ138DRAFT_1173658 [Hygrophoropsis aurantiaca]|uniref:Uncharacterized protein n=1 Tax=Hygrophoropsis aurantiaca TaxID=72124 RepID=A0ACB8A884_9AGAM|nr:hypothetical protein BJ138DRAFT_1173658 [Hygrophoropsis aurantiaca]
MNSSVPRHSVPINKLPVELLSYIFTLTSHSLPDSHQDVIDNQDFPSNAENSVVPSILSAVNRHWRRVAVSTPALWTSLCMSLDNVVEFESSKGLKSSCLDAQQLALHLIRSRNSPLDILIDARDPEWDFTEPSESNDDLPFDTNSSVYRHPFHPRFIVQTLDFLFPHIARWRSLTILTDTWTSMHAAITRLSTPSSGAYLGALLLENLTLMRCNEYIGHSSFFTPSALKTAIQNPFVALFGIITNNENSVPANPLPRLRHLSLVGVHVEWSALSSIISTKSKNSSLPNPPRSLQSLKLAHHCCEVRPSITEFYHILEGCPDLRKLSLKVSGPQILADDDTPETPVSLPLLDELSLSYTDAQEAAKTLSLIHAPNVKRLCIEDATHPASPSEEDGGCLLTYCGTGALLDDQPSHLAGSAYNKADITSIPLARTSSSPHPVKPLYPLLSHLSLSNVKTCFAPYGALLGAASQLHHLALRDIPAHALAALLPRPSICDPPCHEVDQASMIAPCPLLKSLEIWGADTETYHIVGFAMNERERSGTPRPTNLVLHLAHDILPDKLAQIYDGIDVAVDAPMCDELDEEMNWANDDPYASGGAFNDPIFDELYAGAALYSY